MPNIAHADLTDPELHEPKGIAGASADQVYVSDGAAGGAWTDRGEYADIYIRESDSNTQGSIGTTAKTLAFTTNGEDNQSISDAGANRLTLLNAGTYIVGFSISFETNASGDAGAYEFKVLDDGVDTNIGASCELSGTSDRTSAHALGLVTVGAGSHVTVSVESDEAGDTDDITIYNAHLTAYKVS